MGASQGVHKEGNSLPQHRGMSTFPFTAIMQLQLESSESVTLAEDRSSKGNTCCHFCQSEMFILHSLFQFCQKQCLQIINDGNTNPKPDFASGPQLDNCSERWDLPGPNNEIEEERQTERKMRTERKADRTCALISTSIVNSRCWPSRPHPAVPIWLTQDTVHLYRWVKTGSSF